MGHGTSPDARQADLVSHLPAELFHGAGGQKLLVRGQTPLTVANDLLLEAFSEKLGASLREIPSQKSFLRPFWEPLTAKNGVFRPWEA